MREVAGGEQAHESSTSKAPPRGSWMTRLVSVPDRLARRHTNSAQTSVEEQSVACEGWRIMHVAELDVSGSRRCLQQNEAETRMKCYLQRCCRNRLLQNWGDNAAIMRRGETTRKTTRGSLLLRAITRGRRLQDIVAQKILCSVRAFKKRNFTTENVTVSIPEAVSRFHDVEIMVSLCLGRHCPSAIIRATRTLSMVARLLCANHGRVPRFSTKVWHHELWRLMRH